MSFLNRQVRRATNAARDVSRAAEAGARIVGGSVTGDQAMVERGMRQGAAVVRPIARPVQRVAMRMARAEAGGWLKRNWWKVALGVVAAVVVIRKV